MFSIARPRASLPGALAPDHHVAAGVVRLEIRRVSRDQSECPAGLERTQPGVRVLSALRADALHGEAAGFMVGYHDEKRMLLPFGALVNPVENDLHRFVEGAHLAELVVDVLAWFPEPISEPSTIKKKPVALRSNVARAAAVISEAWVALFPPRAGIRA